MLTVTADNGNHIVRYLATTRRWRVAGLGGGITASILLHLPDEVRFDAGVIFAGWFLGALVAEMRVAHLRPGARPAAVVRARRPSAYRRARHLGGRAGGRGDRPGHRRGDRGRCRHRPGPAGLDGDGLARWSRSASRRPYG